MKIIFCTYYVSSFEEFETWILIEYCLQILSSLLRKISDFRHHCSPRTQTYSFRFTSFKTCQAIWFWTAYSQYSCIFILSHHTLHTLRRKLLRIIDTSELITALLVLQWLSHHWTLRVVIRSSVLEDLTMAFDLSSIRKMICFRTYLSDFYLYLILLLFSFSYCYYSGNCIIILMTND
jgi:hypothetical protein